MSVADHAWDAVPAYFKENDIRLVGGLLLGTLLFHGVLAGFLAAVNNASVANAVANSVSNITFLIAVYALLALALNLHWGYTGLFNIGVAGFMAVGVYAMSILAASPTGSPPGLGLPVPIAIVGALLITAVVGGLAALPALQLDADYLAIVTVGLSEIIRLVLNASYFAGTVTDPEATSYNVVDVFGIQFGTGGGQGISTPINSPARMIYETESGLTVVGEAVYGLADTVGIGTSVVVGGTYAAVLLLVFVTAYYVLLSRIGNSPFGRVLKAIREDELVARSLGKDTRLFKIKVFMVGCALMGLGGILWQGSYGFVNPNTFRPIVTFYIFTALIVGGAGSNTGSVVGGAVFAAFLLEGPRRLAGLVDAIAQLLFGSLPRPGNFYEAMVTLDPLAWLGYLIDSVAYLKFILLGAVLVYLMQNRSDGLMGHRSEIAASVDLSDRSTGENGGESDE
ncbi:branched-chain amino acid ABC transporter permease [Halolamina sp. CBA1230]|uniref:branched-chain amino acid ABC transporter permease n=1 Tax=Halolamina sp. CBA1230 TaxID=1853690 RepID=UPI0009A1F537|nr:branched-chain amino acid ABC transporter permease [Halolamina sp. CBA1230]QKY20009.1 branched-chain amino acid ABC transporter permease [Halolamina sp. CBA1230]